LKYEEYEDMMSRKIKKKEGYIFDALLHAIHNLGLTGCQDMRLKLRQRSGSASPVYTYLFGQVDQAIFASYGFCLWRCLQVIPLVRTLGEAGSQPTALKQKPLTKE
jgi:hypothetical protein